MNRTLVWFRRDLRVCDHEPLYRAARRGAVIPVFVFDQALLQHPETGAARVGFMVDCLRHLDQDLRRLGGRLILRSGDPVEVFPRLIEETDAEGIYSYIDCERIYGRARDSRLNQTLADRQMKIRWFEPVASCSELMAYPQYRQWWHQETTAPVVPEPPQVEVPTDVVSEELPGVKQLGHPEDGKPLPKGGTQAARQLLRRFFVEKADRYYWQLSYPSAEITTGLSPHIKFGVISVRECVQAIQQADDRGDRRIQRSYFQLVSRLRWGNGFTQRFRYLPQLELRSLYSIFDKEGWEFDEDLYQAWQHGQTGFPIVDAAARCLQATGGYLALNFRTRAIYSSFLSNLLGMDWRYGALHFMRHLLDGDCPIDHYQWAMQSGVTHCIDKSWTRIYNPQQVAVDRCDPEGLFIKRWVPELAHVPIDRLGTPPPTQGYPEPMLDYRQMRSRRVRQLEQQRHTFLNSDDVVPYLGRMPKDITPFGADRYPSKTDWATAQSPTLFPAALDLDSLDTQQRHDLRTWFVAHVNITPPKIRRRSKPNSDMEQLSLL
ncbi:MAG: deoxyribodipyrimidine photo-lyase [Cyanobacteria bacterium P01_B01_bin.77]